MRYVLLAVVFLFTTLPAASAEPDWSIEVTIPCYLNAQGVTTGFKTDGFVRKSSAVFFGLKEKREGITETYVHADGRYIQIGIFQNPIFVVCLFSKGNMYRHFIPDLSQAR